MLLLFEFGIFTENNRKWNLLIFEIKHVLLNTHISPEYIIISHANVKGKAENGQRNSKCSILRLLRIQKSLKVNRVSFLADKTTTSTLEK